MNQAPWLLLLIFGELRYIMCYSHTPTQYHIQTDRGPNRYFRFQTKNGQYRREKRLRDGSVVGTYGWADPNGLVRLFDYIADKKGYRIARKRTFKAKGQTFNPSTTTPELNSGSPVNEIISNVKKALHTSPLIRKTTSPTPKSQNKAFLRHDSQITRLKLSDQIKFKPKLVANFSRNIKSNNLRPSFATQRSTVPIRRKSSGTHRNLSLEESENSRFGPKSSFGSSKWSSHKGRRKTFPNKIKSRSEWNRRVESTREKSLPTQREANSMLPQINSKRKVSSLQNAKNIPDFGFNRSGGIVTIDFDIGTQYRKEKRFPDGTIVGEYGYVDPFGILRITTYTSGKFGSKEAKKSYWVGTRSPQS